MGKRTPYQRGEDLWEALPGLILRCGGNPTMAWLIRSKLKDLVLEMVDDERVEDREFLLELIRDYLTGR
jgi:hypothetical protein